MVGPLFFIGLFFAAVGGFSFYYYPKKRKTFTEPIDGTVVSFMEGMAYVDKHVGGKYKSVAVKAWYPVVEYTVNGVTHSYTCISAKLLEDPAGFELGDEYKTIPLLYNPVKPAQCSETENVKGSHLITGFIIMLIGIGLMVWSFFV
jgi:hypothetical protein